MVNELLLFSAGNSLKLRNKTCNFHWEKEGKWDYSIREAGLKFVGNSNPYFHCSSIFVNKMDIVVLR